MILFCIYCWLPYYENGENKRNICNIIIYLLVGKICTCLLAGHPPFAYCSIGMVLCRIGTREIFHFIFFLILGKSFTCLIVGHSFLLFGYFGFAQWEIFNVLTNVFVWKILTYLLASHPPFAFSFFVWSFAKLEEWNL